ncbi:MAG: hypothetical protein GF308_20145 [Candidatus Heimdallarchaeota archaeon]|nr:hypothetical protein [Candidatus Heimdallarchaeota archaeon]
MDGLDTLWIIDSNGLCLLQQIFNHKKNPVDKTMFSGFVSAILDFSDHLFDDSLQQITMGKLNFHCLSFSNGKFVVAIAAKTDVNQQTLYRKMVEVGEAFEAEFNNIIGHQPVCLDEFIGFSETVDKIFEVKTRRVLPEHGELLKLLETAEQEQYSEYLTTEAILNFYENLSPMKRKNLLQTTFSILEMFIESDNLTVDQMERFQEILSLQE